MLTSETLARADSAVHTADGSRAAGMCVNRDWSGPVCRLSVTNTGPVPVQLAEVCAFDLGMPYPAGTRFYGEGYSMLSQYKGTLRAAEGMTSYSDHGHYKLPQKGDGFTVYNMLMLFPDASDAVLLGFSSCRRFSGEFRVGTDHLQIVLDCDGLEVFAGQTLELEELFVAIGPCRETLLSSLGERIAVNHPRLSYPAVPTGWCSWYCYGPNVTEQDVFDNLAAIKLNSPGLRFIQIDDGYQKHMGDWLTRHPSFPTPINRLCRRIRDEGFEPAIWVAPFIAEQNAELLKQHPDWFVKDEHDAPLPADRHTFGGWRCGPWYMLDGTHPGAQAHLRAVFRTMRQEWQCRYFKLDANMWGALPFGRRYDANATRVDAYRAGMRALRAGAGEDSFILGCNAPMWPSLGTVHGMRVTDDISRRWEAFSSLAEQAFHRNWQNGRLWINDPDCIVLRNQESPGASADEFSFHAAYILASGGMVLAGDRMMALDDGQLDRLKRLLPPTGTAAMFDDPDFRVGRIHMGSCQLLCLFNWDDAEATYSVPLGGTCSVSDFWSDVAMADNVSRTPDILLPPRSARVLRCRHSPA